MAPYEYVGSKFQYRYDMGKRKIGTSAFSHIITFPNFIFQVVLINNRSFLFALLLLSVLFFVRRRRFRLFFLSTSEQRDTSDNK